MVVGLLLKRVITKAPLKYASLGAFLYVPCMGFVSILLSYYSSFNPYAIALGVCAFCVQWYFIFYSNRFQSLWQKLAFRRAFVINSVLRIPLSIYLDALLGVLLFSLIDQYNGVKKVDIIMHDFSYSLLLTLIHGLIVQFFYGVCLLIIYKICYLFMKEAHA